MTSTVSSAGASLSKLRQTDEFITVRWNSLSSIVLASTAKTTPTGAEFRTLEYTGDPKELKLKPYLTNAKATMKVEPDDGFDKWRSGTNEAFTNLGKCNHLFVQALLRDINEYRLGNQLTELESLGNLSNDFAGKKVIISSETEDGKPFDFIYSLGDTNGEIVIEGTDSIGLKFRTLEFPAKSERFAGYEDLRRFGLMGLATLLPPTFAKYAIPCFGDNVTKFRYGPAIEN